MSTKLPSYPVESKYRETKELPGAKGLWLVTQVLAHPHQPLRRKPNQRQKSEIWRIIW